MARKTEGSALIKGPDSTEPALLMRMAIGPRAASAAVTSRLTSTTSVTSATPHPAASPAATASRSGASERPITVTAAPARASAAATARPMPRPPPVTKACLPASAMASSLGGRESPPGAYFKLKIFKLQACGRDFLSQNKMWRRAVHGFAGGGGEAWMKVHVIGGGPAGLYFAILAKKAWPQTRIPVFERNRPDDTFGFGVVFSDETLDTFEVHDRESYRAIVGHF